MGRKQKLRELINLAKAGDEQAMYQIIYRLIPLVKKYSHQLGYDEACSDLVTWIIEAVYHYRPSTTWGKDELAKYFDYKDTSRN